MRRSVLWARLARAQALADDLREELRAIGETTAQGPDDEHDVEGSSVGYERARVTSLLIRCRADIVELEAAIARLTDGTYRRCQRCQAQIPLERLEALPATRFCVSCAAGPSAR